LSTPNKFTVATLARSGLLLLAFVAALAALSVGRYLVALLGDPADATAAFALVRAANPLVFVAVFVAWAPLVRWIATRSSATVPWRRAIVPGPFAGEPAHLLASQLGARRSRTTRALSLITAYGWPLGLIASHLVHPLAVLVGVAWAALCAVALLLQSAVASRGR
jgi:hypothetical protein